MNLKQTVFVEGNLFFVEAPWQPFTTTNRSPQRPFSILKMVPANYKIAEKDPKKKKIKISSEYKESSINLTQNNLYLQKTDPPSLRHQVSEIFTLKTLYKIYKIYKALQIPN